LLFWELGILALPYLLPVPVRVPGEQMKRAFAKYKALLSKGTIIVTCCRDKGVGGAR
jgi:hypothetical protein